jgi:hypothetical protein
MSLSSLTPNASPVPVSQVRGASAAPTQNAFSFPLLFSGLLDGNSLDDTAGAPQPPAAADKDRKAKDLPTVAVAPAVGLPPLPFVLNIQVPEARMADAKAGGRAPSVRKAEAAPDLPSSLPVPKPDAQPDEQSGAATAAFLLNVPTPVPTPSAIPAAAASAAPAVPPIVLETPARNTPEKAVPLAPGSQWQQTTAKLPNSELAFAARVLQAPDANNPPDKSQADAPAVRESLPLAKAQGPERQPNTGQDQQQQPEPKPQPAATQHSAPPVSDRPRPSEAEPETRAAPASKPAAEVPLPNPAAIVSESAQPVRAKETTQHTAQTAETHLPEPPAASPAPPIRDFSLRLTGPDQDKVEVKVVESAGEIRVAVHSADPELTTSLQQGLGELVGKLESRGMHAETWKPAGESTSAAAKPSETPQNNQHQFSGDGSQGRQSRQQQTPQQRRQNKPGWLQEIDGDFNALHSDIVRRKA